MVLLILLEKVGNNMFLQMFEKSFENPIWKLRSGKNMPVEDVKAVSTTSQDTNCGILNSRVINFSFKECKAKRIYIGDGKNFAVFAEHFTFDEKQCVYTSFEMPVREDLECNVANKNRLVFRTNDTGSKLFRIISLTDGENTIENSGLLMPDGFFDNALMRVTPYSGLYVFGTEQLSLFVMVESRPDLIGAWHIEYKNGLFEISDQNKICRFYVKLDKYTLDVTSVDTNDFVSLKI